MPETTGVLLTVTVAPSPEWIVVGQTTAAGFAVCCGFALIPLLKIAALSWLCAAATGRVHPSPTALGRVDWFTELLGRWSMVDIFVVGILVSLVQLGNYMTILPGPGALAFAAVVMLTMFAAMSFDPRLLWDRMDELSKDSTPTAEPDSP